MSSRTLVSIASQHVVEDPRNFRMAGGLSTDSLS